MPWCPNCKNEYKEGIATCPDCGCDLVSEETDIRIKISFGESDEMEELVEFLRFQNVRNVSTVYDEKDHITEVLVAEIDSEKAKKLYALFLEQKESIKDMSECKSEEEEVNTPSEKPSLYENSASKAEDNKSSAYTLLLVGVAGIVVIILGIADVLPIHFSGISKYMVYGLMGTLFVLFIIMGLASMKSYHLFAKKAESENSLRETMQRWCIDTLKPDELDAELFQDDALVREEEKYFKRVKLMKEKLNRKFLNLDDAFLDDFVDEIYAEVFKE